MDNTINENSMGARLIKAQKDMDSEINGLCSEAANMENVCGNCFRQCFCVSETEFALVYDYIKKNFGREEIRRVINEAKTCWEFLKVSCPEVAETLEGVVTLEELLKMDKIILPFPCVFYNKEKKSCSIFKVRPLMCRVYRGSRFPEFSEVKTCFRAAKHGQRYNQNAVYKKELAFLFLKDAKSGCLIIRRPAPLFYYFRLIFKEDITNDIPEIEFCSDLMQLDEGEYVEKLLDKFGRC